MNSDYKFCPKCAGKLQIKVMSGVERLMCQNCAFVFYLNPIPAVVGILIQDSKLCLVKRKEEPKIGFWCIPGGFLELNEPIEAGLIREIKEETNLDVEIQDIEAVHSALEGPNPNVLIVFYRCRIIGGVLKPGDDAEDARFFSFDEIPEPLAFYHHNLIVEKIKKEFQ